MVTPDALAPFRTAIAPRPDGDPEPLPYLRTEGDWGVDLDLEIGLRSGSMDDFDVISRTSFQLKGGGWYDDGYGGGSGKKSADKPKAAESKSKPKKLIASTT